MRKVVRATAILVPSPGSGPSPGPRGGAGQGPNPPWAAGGPIFQVGTLWLAEGGDHDKWDPGHLGS